MTIQVNLQTIAHLTLAAFLICTALVYLAKWIISPTLFGWLALVSGVCFILSLVVTTSYEVGRKAPPAA
jgi:NADH:ubiquinone oxidoreductase subunit 3 (subunit A)